MNLIYEIGGTFVANADDLYPQYDKSANGYLSQTAVFNSSLVRATGVPASASLDDSQITTDAASGWKTSAAPWFSDQILPFDITLQGTNENGAACSMKIFAVELISEGSGVSIDDSVQEMQATFVARSVIPWMAVKSTFNQVFT